MMRDGECLKPYGDAELEVFNRIGSKKPVMVTVHQPRNPKHHRLLWAMAAKVADFDDDFTDAEDAVEWAKMHIPNMRKEYVLRDGRLAIRTRSINWASLDQVAFKRFFDRAVWLWSEKIGCDPETLLEQV